ncbi:PD40 domain-containing protein [Aggregatilinea lenta]|uniref:PD40 domain-containing protein n=1 Tax=Aggregatilinea lenta TaxID=913108 RepID=UPI000E5B60D2|nr:PD40 domain-containing protein [Aggregatilinea lenta]
MTHNCDDPVLSVVTNACGAAVTFTVSNAAGAGDMLVAQSYTVTQDGTSITPSMSPGSSILLAAGASQTYSVPSSASPYSNYAFTSSGFAGALSQGHDCDNPVIEVTFTCGVAVTATITNTGGDMYTPQDVAITQGSTPQTLDVNQFTLLEDGSITVTVDGSPNPYLPYTFTASGGGLPTVTRTRNCADPALTVTTNTCGATVTFTVTNGTGAGDMLLSQPFTVTQNGADITASITPVGPIQLDAGDSQTYSVPTSANPYDTFVFSSDGMAATLSQTHNCTAPDITVEFTCGATVTATFTNNGGDMLLPQDVSITQGGTPQTLDADQFTLNAGASMDISVTGDPDPYLPYTVTASGGDLATVTESRDCADPDVTVTSSCAYPITFTIANSGGQMFAAEDVTVSSGATTMPLSAASFTLGAGASTTISVTGAHDPYAQYDFSAAGAHLPSESYTHTPCPAPSLSVVTNACGATVTFTVTNDAVAGDMLTGQTFTVTRDGLDISSQITPAGPILLAAGASQTYSVPGDSNPYAAYAFSSAGFTGALNQGHDCDNPNLSIVTNTCGATVSFTLTNNAGAGDMLIPQAFAVTQDGTAITASITPTGPFQLAAGASQTFSVPTDASPYAAYVFSSTGFAGAVSLGHNCDDPAITVTFTCGATVTATITNTGGDMLLPQDVSITQGATAQTIDHTTFQLARDGSLVVSVTGDPNPYLPYTFTASGGSLATITRTRNCDDPALSIVTNACGTTVTFTVTNQPGAGDMLLAQPFTITQNGTDITSSIVPSSTIQLVGGASQTYSVPGTSNPYDSYIFSSTGVAGTLNQTHNCDDPDIEVTFACGAAVSATITNTGGDMLLPQDVTITQDGTPQTLNADTFTLAAGASIAISVTGDPDPYLPYTVTVSGGHLATITESRDCDDPVIEVTSSCAAPITFTVTNTGGEMFAAEDIIVSSGGSDMPISAASFQLGAGGSTTISVTGDHDPYAQYAFSASGNHLPDVNYTHTPCPAPSLSITTNTCGAAVSFTVTNDAAAGDMLIAQAFTVTQDSTNITASITPASPFQLDAGDSQTFSVPTDQSPYAAYIFASSGYAGTLSRTHDCADPDIDITFTCGAAVTATITNTGGDMLLPQDLTITQGAIAQTLDADTFTLTSGNATTISVTGDPNPYLPYTVTASGGHLSTVTESRDCADPVIEVSSTCAASITFTVTNTGGQMFAAQDVTVMQSGTPQALSATGFTLGAGNSTTITLTGAHNEYLQYDFSATGGSLPDATYTHPPCAGPNLSVTHNACGATVAFTVINTGGPMLTAQIFSILQDGATDVTPSPGGILLATNESQTFTLPADSDPYAAYTFASTGTAGTLNDTKDCDAPVLSMDTNTCGAMVEFTLSNSGAPMLVPQSFTLFRDGLDISDDVTPASPYLLGTGESVTLTLPDTASPYASYLLTSSGFADDLALEHNCDDPAIKVEAMCTGSSITFTITNTGADMLRPHDFSIMPKTGFGLSPSNISQLDLTSGEHITLAMTGIRHDTRYTLSTGAFGIEGEADIMCKTPFVGAAGDQSSTPTPSPTPEVTSTPAGIPGLGGITAPSGLDVLPPWSSVPTCEVGCPDWLIYHTNETGDWEIFRLDGFDAEARETYNVNLSNGQDIDDMAPSRSPNSEWVVFTSNRDGNWELYVAPSNGDVSQIERLTYNEIAIDTDPIWGPNNFVAFETTRDGNWEIYLIDMGTGREYRVTDDPASDLNPFWSPDGARLLFQSDRSGLWQIYELDLRTLTLTVLSDGSGDDVDPQYSFDGEHIVFRSYRDTGEDGNSVIYLMDANGDDPHAISDPNGDATNQVWSPDDQLIAYQSNLDGDLDIYVYDVASGETREVTGNGIADYAPMWRCDAQTLVFTSDLPGNPDIYETDALPISADPVDLNVDGDQMTYEAADDIYPENMPPEENASREGHLPPLTPGAGEPDVTLGMQTNLLKPQALITPRDPFRDGTTRDDYQPVEGCPVQ